MNVRLESPQSPTRVAAVPRHFLGNDKGRSYVFIDLIDSIRVRKYHGWKLVEDKEVDRSRARSLWAWLKKIGYTMW